MPPIKPHLQTIPPELRNKIYEHLAPTSTRTILGRRFLAAHKSNPHSDAIYLQFNNATTLHPLSMTCRQLAIEFTPVFTAAGADLPPLHYDLIVNNFNLEQLDLFRWFTEEFRPIHLSAQNFELRLQFDSGVVESALVLERAVVTETAERKRRQKIAEENRDGREKFQPLRFLPCSVQGFILLFALRCHHSKGAKAVVSVEGGGGDGDGGGKDKAMTKSQAKETIESLRRVREALQRVSTGDRDGVLVNIAVRFEYLVGSYVWRSDGTLKPARMG